MLAELAHRGVVAPHGGHAVEHDLGAHLLPVEGAALYVVEQVHAADAPEVASAGDNVIHGRVRERLYRGSRMEYTVVAGETELVVVDDNRGQGMFEIGAGVALVMETTGVVTLDG